jgi:hypothetical protein
VSPIVNVNGPRQNNRTRKVFNDHNEEQTWHGNFEFTIINFSHAFHTLKSNKRAVFKAMSRIGGHENDASLVLVRKEEEQTQ